MFSFKTFSYSFVTSSLLFTATLCAENLQWDPKLTQGELANGFDYVFYQSADPKEPFNLRLIVGAGSVDDDKRGMAHIVEHMVFRANRGHERDMHRFFDQIGWKTGTQVNALTRQTETQYMVRTRPNDSLNLDQSVELMSDLAFGAKMLDEDWQIEREVIYEEMRKGAGVAERINVAKKEIVRNGSRYIDRPTIGIKEDIASISIEDIRTFYDTFYVPANMTLVASGYFDATALTKSVTEHFGTEEAKPAPLRDYVELPLKAGLVIGKVQDPKGTSSAVVYGLRSELKPNITEEGAYQRLQNYFLRTLVKSMVFDSKELHKSSASSVSITFSEPTNERLIIALQARTEDHQAGLEIVLTELERLKQNGIQEAELNKLKDKAKAVIAKNKQIIPYRDFAKWEDKLTSAVMQQSVEEDYSVKAARNLKWIDEMTLESLNARLAELLSAPDQFMFYQIPGKLNRTLPSVQEVQNLAKNIAKKKLTLLAKAPAKPMLPKAEAKAQIKETIVLPKAETAQVKLLSKHQFFAPNVTQWKLANGDSVIWLDKETPKDELYIKVLSSAGYYSKGHAPWLMQAASQIWQQSDYANITNKALQTWQEENKIKWSWAQKETELDLSAKVTKAKLGELMNLYAIMQKNWQLNESQFLEVKKSLQQLIKPASIDKMVLDKLWGTPLNLMPNQQAIDNLTLETFKASVKTLSEQPISLFIVGKLTANDIESQVLPYLASIKRDASLTPLKPVLPLGKHIVSQQMHNENKSTVTIKAESEMSWSPEASFLVSTLNPIVQKALKNKLRHELGGIYSLRYEMGLDKDSKVRMTTSFTTSPEKVDLLINAHNQVLSDLPSLLVAENYPRIQQDIRFAEDLRLTDTNTWLRRLTLSFEKYDDPKYLQSMLALEKQVTKAQLDVFAKTILPLSKQAILIGTPKS